MAGHGEKYTRLREQAIAALLQHKTISATAKSLNLSERALRSWLKREDFGEQYRLARQQTLEAAIGIVQASAGEAAETLKKNLGAPRSADSTKAARAILDFASRAELSELRGRVRELERQMKQPGGTVTVTGHVLHSVGVSPTAFAAFLQDVRQVQQPACLKSAGEVVEETDATLRLAAPDGTDAGRGLQEG
jgi:hypothetical protein